ncbi:phosphoglycerate mutase-like protein 1 isoform X3 [Fagus crenata]
MEKEGEVVCVTRGSGCIGPWLVRELLDRGYIVHATVQDLKNESETKHLESLEGAEMRLRLFQIELLDYTSILRALTGCAGVFHLASPCIVNQVHDPEVRHAQGIHNVYGEKNHDAYKSYDFFDANITPLGWSQVGNLRKHVHATGLSKKIDLVVVSPLLRTMQTAVGVFGGEAYTDGVNVPPLMVANTGNSDHPAISSLNSPPFVAVELCRERLGVNPCDKRRSIREYHPLFPAIDFSLLESDEDILWKPDIRENDEEVAARGLNFLKWLWTRKEQEIAIVTHSAFLLQTLRAFGNDCHSSVKIENFANCELRSVVIIDRIQNNTKLSYPGSSFCSMLGSDSSTTNYPGKIPDGLHLPSDVATEKHPNIFKIFLAYF